MATKRSTGLLDKLNGIKTNLIANGSFTTDTTSWTGAGATLSSTAGGQSGNCLTITNSAGASGSAYQDVTTVVGRTYKLSFYFKQGVGALSGKVKVGTTGADSSILTSNNYTDVSFTQQVVSFVATASTTRITLVNNSTVVSDTALFDTIVLEEILDGFVEIFRKSKFNIYSTPRPATADDAATGTLLSTITIDGAGTGLTFNDSNNGVVSKPGGVVWKGLNSATGTAAWFRLYEEGDTPGSSSTTMARLDGSISLVGAGGDMIAADTALTSGLYFEITGFSYTPVRG